MRMRLASYLLVIVALLGTAAIAPRAWATPVQTRPGQGGTVPTPTPKGQPTPKPEPPTAQPPVEPSPTLPPGAPSPTPGQATPTADAPRLVFTKEATSRLIWPGATVRYVLTLTNAGASSARQVIITDTLPPELLPGPVLAGAATWEGQTLRAEVAILPPGGQLTVAFTATVRSDAASGRVVMNRASATAAGGVRLEASALAVLPPAELPPTGGVANCRLQIADLEP